MIIDAETGAEIKKLLDALPGKVSLVFFKENLLCKTCGPAEELLTEVAALSPNIELKVYNRVTDAEKAAEYGVDRTPAVIVEGPRSGRRVRFYGIPAGYEFVSFMEAMKNAVSPELELEPETLETLSKVTAPVNIKVFVTPTCPYCPAAVVLAHRFAVASPSITAEMVEATEFPEMAQKFGVEGVPRIVINDRVSLVGAQPESLFSKAVLDASAPPAQA